MSINVLVLLITGKRKKKNPHWTPKLVALLPSTVTLGSPVLNDAVGDVVVLLLHHLVQRPHQQLLTCRSIHRNWATECEESVLQIERPLLSLKAENHENTT